MTASLATSRKNGTGSNVLRIRPARPSDLHAMNAVKTGAALDMIGPHSALARRMHHRHPHHWYGSAKRWRGALVAEVAGRVVGVVFTRGALFSDLWVDRSVRSQGIGAVLARAGEDKIRRDGHRIAHLYTALFNTRGRAFYERHGWTLTRHIHHHVLHFRRCVYVKRL